MEKNEKQLLEIYLGNLRHTTLKSCFATDSRKNGNEYIEIHKILQRKGVLYAGLYYPLVIDSVQKVPFIMGSEPPVLYGLDGKPDVVFSAEYYAIGFINKEEHDIIFFQETLDYIRGINYDRRDLPEMHKYYPATAEELISLIESNQKLPPEIGRLRKRRFIAALGTIFKVIKNNDSQKEGRWFLVWDKKEKKFDFESFSQHWTSPAPCSEYFFLARKNQY